MDAYDPGAPPPDIRTPAADQAAGAQEAGEAPRNGSSAPSIQSLGDQVDRLLTLLNGPVQFVSIVPRGTGDGPTRFAMFEVGDPAAAAFVARNDAEGRASYYSLNITRPGLSTKATKADIVAARGLHADIDPPKDGTPFDRAAALTMLATMPIAPTYIVDSGGGFQPVWLFDAPVTDLALVEDINRRLAHLTGGDHCHNIDRLLRVPGSLNTPDAKKAASGRVPARASFVA